MANEFRKLASGIVVWRVAILGGACVTYTAWEPYAGHSALTHFDGVGHGDIATRSLPATLAILPYGDERIVKVRAHYETCREQAYAAIVEAYPEAAGGKRNGGEIIVDVPR